MGRKKEWILTLVLAREQRPQKRAGEAHEFQSANKLLLILSYTEELELDPDPAHSGHELQRGNWNKSPGEEKRTKRCRITQKNNITFSKFAEANTDAIGYTRRC